MLVRLEVLFMIGGLRKLLYKLWQGRLMLDFLVGIGEGVELVMKFSKFVCVGFPIGCEGCFKVVNTMLQGLISEGVTGDFFQLFDSIF